MTSLDGDIVNRVRRLPKPTSAAEALQPLFEAVSNALHAVEDAYGDEYQERGRIEIVIHSIKTPQSVKIIVSDNGVGLDEKRFEAFCTTDTAHKMKRGGKGIGRLLWLDAFEKIRVESVFKDKSKLKRRAFDFRLTAKDQIVEEPIKTVGGGTTGTVVTFTGVRDNAYRERFIIQPATLVKHFGSHFFADFILGKAPQITLEIDGEATTFPEAITDLRIEDRGVAKVVTSDFGELELASFICDKTASANFDGLHQLHLVANGRTVVTRKIDGLVGVGRLGENDDLVYHGCVTGDFLDDRVNQERTQFNFDEKVVEQVVKSCAVHVREHVLADEVRVFDGERLNTLNVFTREYPTFAFEEPQALLARVPKNAVKAEQFAQALIPLRIRRDAERNESVRKIVAELGAGTPIPADFAEAVRQAADDVRSEEQRQLTEYVLRRKIVLEVLDVLIRRIREINNKESDHHLEQTLHQFICPMKVRGDDSAKIERSAHDLWVIDERLTFAKYFASDVPFSQIVKDSKSAERMDLFVFDRLHGLGLGSEEPLRRVMLVEFKKPGRTDYDERYSPMNQISRYASQLKNGTIENFKNERVRVADDCVFYCYVVADIVGSLEMHTSGWRTTANGRGRIMDLSGKHRGIIEIIEWKDLLSDARMRNLAFIQAAGAKFEDYDA
jgi:hypothetical protein